MSGQAAAGSGPGNTVALGSLPIEQLEKLEEGMSAELEMMQRQLAVYTDGVQRLQASKESAEAIGTMKAGSELMVPLTSSIYVPGALKDVSTVLVDIGTGYYIEKKPADAAEYFGRRASVLKTEGEKTASALTEKRHHYEAVTSVLQRKRLRAAKQANAGQRP